MDHGRTLTVGSEGEYGAHWWLGLGGADAFHASGYRGQYTLVVPTRDLVVVRLGASTPEQRENVRGLLNDLVESFPADGGEPPRARTG
jgi:CubicO group peptidase (beta-lactamase class C family)